MTRRRMLLALTAGIEVAAGLALLIAPAIGMQLLLGVGQSSPEASVAARVGGAALVAFGMACWSGRSGAGANSHRGLIVSILAYNLAVMVVLTLAGSRQGLSGALLWPTVLLHAVLAGWCVVDLVPMRSPADAEH